MSSNGAGEQLSKLRTLVTSFRVHLTTWRLCKMLILMSPHNQDKNI